MTTKRLLLIFTLLSSATIFGQRVIDVDKFDGNALDFLRTVGGEPLMNTKFVRLVEGTPYFSDKWMKGNVVIEQSEYRNLLLRVNILETTLSSWIIREAMVCTNPVKQVVLKDSIKGVQYYFTHSAFSPKSEFKRCWLMELVTESQLYKIEKNRLMNTDLMDLPQPNKGLPISICIIFLPITN
jgi:hypothetical protein